MKHAEANPHLDSLDTLLQEHAVRFQIESEQAEQLLFLKVIVNPPKRLELHPEVKALARIIDHTYLTITPDKPWTDIEQVVRLCREAAEYGFASVCVRPNHVKLARKIFDYWDVKDIAVCTVIDFPKYKGEIAGTAEPKEKASEALQAQQDGATEFDMVINYQAVLAGNSYHARDEVAAVCNAVKNVDPSAIIKVIMETARLRKQGGWLAIGNACHAVVDGGADFGKTSTGFANEGGATIEDVCYLSETLHPCGVQVKASGGIRDLKTVELMQEAGADRLGLSGSVPIIKDKIEQCSNIPSPEGRWPGRGGTI